MNDTTPSAMETFSDPQVKERKPTFAEWLKLAKPGESFIYFTGHSLGAATPEEDVEAKAALQAFADGKIELCQRRVGKKFEYLAQKRPSCQQCTVNPSAPAWLQSSEWPWAL
jgi:hypothetical protein